MLNMNCVCVQCRFRSQKTGEPSPPPGCACGTGVVEDVLQGVPNGPKTKESFTAVTPHNPSISDLSHDHPSSVARQQRKKPDPWPPQAAGALKIALLGAHAEHGPRGALKELDHSTLLLRPLSVLCRSHLQAIPMPCGGIEPRLCSPKHQENIGPQMTSCAPRSRSDERTVGAS